MVHGCYETLIRYHIIGDGSIRIGSDDLQCDLERRDARDQNFLADLFNNARRAFELERPNLAE